MVSVIIPLYNGEKFIRKTIQSILNQTYKDVEIIIVDTLGEKFPLSQTFHINKKTAGLL